MTNESHTCESLSAVGYDKMPAARGCQKEETWLGVQPQIDDDSSQPSAGVEDILATAATTRRPEIKASSTSHDSISWCGQVHGIRAYYRAWAHETLLSSTSKYLRVQRCDTFPFYFFPFLVKRERERQGTDTILVWQRSIFGMSTRNEDPLHVTSDSYPCYTGGCAASLNLDAWSKIKKTSELGGFWRPHDLKNQTGTRQLRNGCALHSNGLRCKVTWL
jgi:hypothetical protein